MSLKMLLICIFFIQSIFTQAQLADTLNRLDKDGKRQGWWIKKYPGGKILSMGRFKDGKPVGEFRRYFENDTLQSLLIFSDDGKKAVTSIFHPNGFIASKGLYVNQMKEGKWQFFSAKSDKYLICEEFYCGNIRNGLSLKFYSNGKIAERVNYVNDVRQGEWTRFYPNGNLCLRANYSDGLLQGKFEAYFDNGRIQFSGAYKDDARNGPWNIYNKDGSVKYKIEYTYGRADNQKMYEDASDYLDSLENHKSTFEDPETTRKLW